jgi:hypothetical protein
MLSGGVEGVVVGGERGMNKEQYQLLRRRLSDLNYTEAFNAE